MRSISSTALLQLIAQACAQIRNRFDVEAIVSELQQTHLDNEQQMQRWHRMLVYAIARIYAALAAGALLIFTFKIQVRVQDNQRTMLILNTFLGKRTCGTCIPSCATA